MKNGAAEKIFPPAKAEGNRRRDQCFKRLSHRLLSQVPTLWNSCTNRIRMTTATSITRYL